MSITPIKLLVVDDMSDVGDFMKHYLSVRRFEVNSVSSAEKALEILDKQPVDIVLLDLLLRGMNGAAAAKIIKDKYPKVKIIVVTAFPTEAENLNAELKLDGVFIKPFGLYELFTKLIENY